MIEIKSRFLGKVLYKSIKKTMKEAVIDAVNKGADLWGANLWGADLEGADLRGANLDVKSPPVHSHDFVSEILYRESKTEAQFDFSARILRQKEECWEFFLKLAKKKKVLSWAKKVLFKWDGFKEQITKSEND